MKTHVFKSGGWVGFDLDVSERVMFATDDGAQLVYVDAAELAEWVLSMPIKVLERVPLPSQPTPQEADHAQ